MTLEEGEQTQKPRTENTPTMEVGKALHDVLCRAKEESRLTCGIYECATLLGKDPEGVVLCLLADNSLGDVALHMHFTLIEAFCWENDIRLMKVAGYEKLVKLLANINNNEPDLQEPVNPQNFCCITLQCHPTAEKDVALDEILEYYRVMSEVTPYPTVTLGE
ncbi:growth arrest and DNA damage-inducible protein GADD45 alpha-like [Glandiceps talaboti]